jgi:hypothetical protein
MDKWGGGDNTGKKGLPPFFFAFLFFKCLDKIGAWKKYIVLIAEKKF